MFLSMSEKEQSGCRRLLELLSAEDLMALKDTVTNRLISVESTREAVEAIIAYSQSAEELLKRRKVHREVIFQYLAKEGVAVPPNTEKLHLVRRTLALWSDKKLIFCPNLEQSGLKCLSTPHGLVLVAVAGTIHRENLCLGIFEQVFGLIRDPLEGNRWKMKYVHLKIKGQVGGKQLPVLTYESDDMLQLFTT
uniref:Chromosome 3 open reading frame 38 n=1 Tax=Astyanax mexicanus TaxID=7994 RepID=A0A8B9RP94_ASTMX